VTALGGPDGGNGGKGGDVIFQTDSNLSTLYKFRTRKKFFAQNGGNGAGKKCSGKSGEDLFIKIPCGTIIRDLDSGNLVCDMNKPGMNFVVARGGKGGIGNFNLKSSVNRAPKYAKKGKPGEYFNLCLELKLLADVGLIGMPNAGKSTIISAISGARPKIANYPFTTLSPILGVVNYFDKSFVVADIPGLIEGASRGAGLGHEFLKHVQRCKVLVHVVDVSLNNAIENFEIINHELCNFDKKFKDYPMLVVANKIDIASEENILKFENYINNKKLNFFKISATNGLQSLDSLLGKISEFVLKANFE
jgi:GTP-binding protein